MHVVQARTLQAIKSKAKDMILCPRAFSRPRPVLEDYITGREFNDRTLVLNGLRKSHNVLSQQQQLTDSEIPRRSGFRLIFDTWTMAALRFYDSDRFINQFFFVVWDLPVYYI
jgi:hypothetical protein